MVERKVDDGVAGQNQLHLVLEVGPLLRSPEVVDDQESSCHQEASQALNFRVGEGHAAHFESVEVGEAAYLGIDELDRMFAFERVEIGQKPIDEREEDLIGLRKVRRPRAAAPVKAPAVARVCDARKVELAGDAAGLHGCVA